MDISKARFWNFNDIQKIINNNILENKQLEFKACAALDMEYKNEISKDVSSFANSAGGVIIYGIKEIKEGESIYLELDQGFFINEKINKEWLENVIYSRISPKIDGLYINPVDIGNEKLIYVVVIPPSNTAHMAGNNRYYKRRNFKSEPMEDYEVRDVMNRQKKAKLQLRLTVPREIPYDSNYYFHLTIKNIGNIMVKYFAVRICIPEVIIANNEFKGGRRKNIRGVYYREYIKQGEYRQFIFPDFYTYINNKFLPPISAKNSERYKNSKIYWTIYSDNNNPQYGQVRLKIITKKRIISETVFKKDNI